MRCNWFLTALTLAIPLHAQTIDFDSPSYPADKPLIDSDGWSLLRDGDGLAASTFRIAEEAGNRFLRAQTSKSGVAYRDFPQVTGTVSLSWRWRASGDMAHLCLGVTRKLPLASGLNPRALACIDPYGTLEMQGSVSARALKETWTKQKWQYLRLVMDAAANTTVLYAADSASRSDERIAVAALPMNDIGELTRVVLVNTDGASALDIDDLVWEPVSAWTGLGPDSNWTTAANWSAKTIPDSTTRVSFDGSAIKGCMVDKPAFAGSLEFSSLYKGNFNLGNATLTVSGRADFSGAGSYAAGPSGEIVLNGSGRQFLAGPDGARRLPSLRHTGSGSLVLAVRALNVSGFLQNRGTLDFNGFDLSVSGSLSILNGGPASLANLDGRAMMVSGTALFEGISADTLLSLRSTGPAPKGWSITVPIAGNLTARYASLGNGRAAGSAGQAILSADAGGNSGWIFAGAPDILSQPKDLAVKSGQTAEFRIGAASTISLRYQWLRNGVEIPRADDSVYALKPAYRSDNGALFSCRVQNNAGQSLSAGARLSVDFPAPEISPATGTFKDSLQARITTAVPGASLFYSANGSAYKPYPGTLVFRDSTLLAAFAVIGPDTSVRVIRNYPKAGGKDTVTNPIPVMLEVGATVTLAPAHAITVAGNYAFSGPQTGAPVAVQSLGPDSVAALPGFADIPFAIRFYSTGGGSEFPMIAFDPPANEARALYRMERPNAARFIAKGGAEITSPGVYFLALDTLTPRIELARETAAGDSTRTVFLIRDNVVNLKVDLSRSEGSGAGFAGKSVAESESLVVVLKSPPGLILPLGLRLEATDGIRRTAFPAAGGRLHFLARSTSGTARTPSLFRIGEDKESPWDLVAFPIALDPPPTLAGLRRDNAATSLQAAVWDESAGQYRTLGPDDPMLPGASLWLGTVSGKLPSLAFASVKTAARTAGEPYRITLRKGWNQVANPSFATLYWPVPRAASAGYAASPVKGLHRYDAVTGGFAHSDSLEPWRGYFAFYRGDKDTTIELRFAPAVPGSAAKSGALSSARSDGSGPDHGIRIRLGLAQAKVDLGAADFASDGIGSEDESRPPGFGNRAASLGSLRAGRTLETDYLHWRPGSGFAWKVVARAAAASGTKGVSGTQARVDGLDLPAGYSAWAVSHRRGLRFRLGLGDAIPMAQGFSDSLEVFAGPTAELDARLRSIPFSTGDFNAAFTGVPGGIRIDLRLPAATALRWSLWSLDGRLLQSGSAALAQGIYSLPAGRGRQAPGAYAVSLEWKSEADAGAPSGRLNRKVVIP